MSKANTYREIASNFRMWRESFDTGAEMTQAEFEALSVEDGVAMLVDAFGPEPKTIKQIVAEALEGQSQAYLEDVAAHGIHNITNDYSGDDYDEFGDEFEAQAKAALAKIESQRDEE